MKLPEYASPLERVWHYTYLFICASIFLFLIGIFVGDQLSFTSARPPDIHPGYDVPPLYEVREYGIA